MDAILIVHLVLPLIHYSVASHFAEHYEHQPCNYCIVKYLLSIQCPPAIGYRVLAAT